MKAKRVLILNPPNIAERFSRDGRCQSEENTWLDTFPPTTFAGIAGNIREHHDVLVIDAIGSRLDMDQIEKKIRLFRPQFTVINTSTPTIKNDAAVASRIKKLTGSKIIIYGEHVTARPKELLEEFPAIDFALLGDPETPALEVINGNLEAKGIATRKSNTGQWIEEDLDRLPFPAYDLLPVYRYPITQERWMFVRSGKGCPYGCIYCVMPMLGQRKVRYHSPEYMVRQYEWLINDLGIRLWMVWDELATFDKGRMLKISDLMVKKGLDKKCKWFCTSRVDLFDDELAEAMQRAGCRMISFGFESADDSVLKKVVKGATVAQAEKAIKAAKDNSLDIIGHFIIGLPGSTPESDKKTVDFAIAHKINFAQFYVATPFPGSRFYQMAKEKSWITTDNWKEVEQGTVTVSYPDYTKEQIENSRRKAYFRFYIRPFMFMNVLERISFNTLLKMPAYLLKFFDWMKK